MLEFHPRYRESTGPQRLPEARRHLVLPGFVQQLPHPCPCVRPTGLPGASMIILTWKSVHAFLCQKPFKNEAQTTSSQSPASPAPVQFSTLLTPPPADPTCSQAEPLWTQSMAPVSVLWTFSLGSSSSWSLFFIVLMPAHPHGSASGHVFWRPSLTFQV